MATDRELYRRWVKGQLNPLTLSGTTVADQAASLETLANQINRKHVCFYKPADATSATWAQPILYTRTAIQLINVSVLAGATQASNATNFSTMSVEYDDGAGGADTQVAYLNTNVTALTATQKSEMTLASNVDIPASKSVLFKKSITGVGGEATPACVIDVHYQEV